MLIFMIVEFDSRAKPLVASQSATLEIACILSVESEWLNWMSDENLGWSLPEDKPYVAGEHERPKISSFWASYCRANSWRTLVDLFWVAGELPEKKNSIEYYCRYWSGIRLEEVKHLSSFRIVTLILE